MKEKWKDVFGFDEYFKISDFGRIYSKRSNKILKQTKNKQGYMTISTKIGGRNGKFYTFRVHRLVAQAFLSKPSDELINKTSKLGYGNVPVNHKDYNRSNNHISNLEWCTHKYNSNYSKNNLKIPDTRGCRNGSSKLTRDDVMDILENLVPYSKTRSFKYYSKKYGVNKSTIIRVYNKNTWNK